MKRRGWSWSRVESCQDPKGAWIVKSETHDPKTILNITNTTIWKVQIDIGAGHRLMNWMKRCCSWKLNRFQRKKRFSEKTVFFRCRCTDDTNSELWITMFFLKMGRIKKRVLVTDSTWITRRGLLKKIVENESEEKWFLRSVWKIHGIPRLSFWQRYREIRNIESSRAEWPIARPRRTYLKWYVLEKCIRTLSFSGYDF